jgi:hypothetical protein
MTVLKELIDQCQAVDQGLWRIKAKTDRLKKNQAVIERYGARKPDYALYQAFIECNQSVKPVEVMQALVRSGGSASWKPCTIEPTHATTHVTRCYACGQEGHYAKDCLSGSIKLEVALVLDSYESVGESMGELGAEEEELGKGQP